MDDQLAILLASALRLGMPLMLAAMGELVSERAGVLNLSLEGFMLTGAFFGALGAWWTGEPWLGVVAAVAAVLPLALAQAWLSVDLRANQLVVGIGFNILALGATTLLYRLIFGALSNESIPGMSAVQLGPLAEIPVIGPMLFAQTPLLYLGLALIAALAWLLARTSLGLAIRAAGDNPRATDVAGVDVRRVRYLGVLIAGTMAALGGSFLSLADVNTFTEGMTKGAGYLALAAVIFGAWRPGRAMAACLLFGAAAALQFQLPALGVQVPTAALLMLPYVLALLAVAGLVGRQDQPLALALPYRRGSH
jgi:simple sugar transport system permease protein